LAFPPSSHEHARARSLAVALVLAGVIAALLLAGGADANPSIQDKQAQAAAILTQVQELDAEVGDAAERWNGANYKLGQISAQLDEAKRDLVRARRGVELSQARAGARLRELYMSGDPAGPVEVILGAADLQEILAGLDMSSRIARQDGRIIKELETYRRRVIAREGQLTTARARQGEVVQQRAAEKAAIEAKLAERRQLLSSVEAEVRQLVAAERRRQAELRRQAQARLAEQQAVAAAARRQAEERAQLDALSSSGVTAPAGEATIDIPAAAPADAGRAAQVVSIAMQYLGVPYVWGGASPSGFDCSGLTSFVYAQIGVSLPHFAAAQYGYGASVSRDDLQPGDLVFFHGLGHMGMYIGGGSFVHAPHTGDVVKISSIYEGYYSTNWVGARRVL
jgi:peptidoglycan DL-endopeptidase CwlO